MEPYKEIIIKFIIENGEKLSSGTKLEISAKDIVESECYQLILKIKAIIEYAFMSDTQKAVAIEKIISGFNESGITVKYRWTILQTKVTLIRGSLFLLLLYGSSVLPNR